MDKATEYIVAGIEADYDTLDRMRDCGGRYIGWSGLGLDQHSVLFASIKWDGACLAEDSRYLQWVFDKDGFCDCTPVDQRGFPEWTMEQFVYPETVLRWAWEESDRVMDAPAWDPFNDRAYIQGLPCPA